MIVIFHICKSQVLTSFSSVVSRVNIVFVEDPIHPHLLSSDAEPATALPGKTVSILAAIAATFVPTPLISYKADSVGAVLSLCVSKSRGYLAPVKTSS